MLCAIPRGAGAWQIEGKERGMGMLKVDRWPLRRCIFSVSLAVAMMAVSSAAWAVPVRYGFTNITNNNAGDAAIGEAQLFVDVDNGGGTVNFTFVNEGPEASVISEIYFDNGSLLGIASIIDSPSDVDFVEDASPPNLPGGDTVVPPFEVTEAFLAEAIPEPPTTGVGPGEQVTIVFDLIGGGTLADVIDELNDGTLRIGIHVIAFDSGFSEGFMTPEPTSVALLALGALMLLPRRRR